jgi:transcriptional regulator with XRE-family HTH domain
MDKRDLGTLFRDRLLVLIERFGRSHSRFAGSIGLDRSGLSQLLAEGSTRLPRAETLHRISEVHQVSLDWLLGLSQSDQLATEIAPTLEIEALRGELDDSQLTRWHREAVGYKIRYVPKSIPDLLRTEAVTLYEHRRTHAPDARTKLVEADRRLAYTRRPETDMEVCMPLQALRTLARGEGIWSELPLAVRERQLSYMSELLDELYPTFRLFLYDAFDAFSAPYTVFGPIRAALYLGQMYLVVNSVEHIRALTRHFDDLIRVAKIDARQSAEYVRGCC